MRILVQIAILITLLLPKGIAFAADAWISELLPKELRLILPGLTGSAEVIRILGQPAKKKQNLMYYNFGGVSYDLTFAVTNSKISYFIYDLPVEGKQKSNFYYNQLSKNFNSKPKTEMPSHQSGRELVFHLPEHSTELTFSALGNQRLKRIYQWAKGKPKP